MYRVLKTSYQGRKETKSDFKVSKKGNKVLIKASYQGLKTTNKGKATK